MSDSRIVIKSAEFLKSAANFRHWPEHALPEAAFAGRSNVGKSSLINCLLNRKKLVRTSSTPGRTQLLNFFTINDALCFVDLPGYGFAKAPAKVRDGWKVMVEEYLSGRRILKAVVLILDVRRDPGPEDLSLLKKLRDLELEVIPVATKMDKLKKSARASRLKELQSGLNNLAPRPIPFSAETREGKELVWKALLQCLEPASRESSTPDAHPEPQA